MGSRYVKWSAVDSVGAAVGIILLWDVHKVHVLDCCGGSFSIYVIIKDVEKGHQ